MRKIISSVLAGSMFFATACSTKKNDKQTAPTAPVHESKIAETNNSIQQAGIQVDQAQNGQGSNFYLTRSALLRSTVNSLIANSDMAFMDESGKKVSIETYQTNPTQYYLAFKDKETAGLYHVLKTNAATPVNSQIIINFDIYSIVGDMNAFNSTLLVNKKFSDSLALSTDVTSSKANIQAFAQRLKGVKLTQNSNMLNIISDFLFPKAYADTSYEDKLMITAIVFTSVAVLSYIFAWRGLGNISVTAGLVFWLLYFFQ